ncbi:MAG: hypothetical protein ACI8S6_002920 [Myxococcota bacterium]|jgi:hypothetical protein
MGRAWLWGAMICWSIGCGRRQASPENPADPVTLSEIEGVWILALSQEESHRLLIRKLALSNELPGEPELRAMGLNAEDLGVLRQLRALPRDAPQWEALADEVAHMEGGSLTITRRTMRMDLGARSRQVEWSLISRSTDTLTIQFHEDGAMTEGTIRVGLDGTLVFIDSEGNELLLERL